MQSDFSVRDNVMDLGTPTPQDAHNDISCDTINELSSFDKRDLFLSLFSSKFTVSLLRSTCLDHQNLCKPAGFCMA
jgi:hypothetical protein